MLTRDKWRLGVIAIVLLLSAIAVFPISGRVKLGLDLKGGAHIVLQAKGTPEVPVDDDSLERLIVVLRNRIDQYGIVEPQIQREGSDRVAIDLPGADDPDAALELIGRTAVLEFRQVLEDTGQTEYPPVERKNYDNDEDYQRALNNVASQDARIALAIGEMERRSKSDDSALFARGENNSAFLLG
jgi:preprotein translocase subunit SecD